MIVDDHEGMRRVLKSILTRAISEPFHLIECESGEQAVTEYTAQLPDCVLMDFELNAMNGLEATKIIIEKDINAKIIIVTGYDSAVLRRKAEDLNVQGLVSKEHLSELTPILQNISIT